MFGLGPTELLLILIIALIIFGPSKLPEIGKSILRAVVQFRQTSQEIEEEVKKGITEPLTGDLKKASQELEEEVKEVKELTEPLTGDLKKTSQELEEEVKKGLTEPSEKEKKRDNSSNAKKRTKRLLGRGRQLVEKKMTFTQHLDELRKRLMVSLVAVVITTLFSYFYSLEILEILTRPAGNLKLHYLSPLEPMVARLKVAIFSGVGLAFPLLFYEFLTFVSPAFRREEKKYIYPGLFFAIILFATGVTLGYLYIMPLGFQWLLGQAGGILVQVLTVSQYISFMGWFLLAFGLAFETPLVIFLLVKLGVVKRETLRKQWRYVYVIILFAAAIATPDWSPVTMMAVALPMILLYEIGLLLSRFF